VSRSRRRTPASLDLSFTAASGRGYVPFLRRNLLAAHRMLRPPLHELSLALVGDAAMSRLHRRYLGVSGPTDVLSFALEQAADGKVRSGELVVCVPVAARQARRHKIPLRLELLLYALHGMLHLCGHDDRTPRRYSAMHKLEDDILRRLGFTRVFAAGSPGGTE
jgi:probable rRNA maturation factor